MITDEVQVDLFGVACNTNTPDADGNVWSVEEVRGWDGPDQRTQQMLPSGRHGARLVDPYANGREIVVVGEVLADTQDGAWEVYNLLTSSMPGINGEGDLVVHEPGVAKRLTLVQSGPPKVDPPLHRSVRFMLTLLAEDPWKRALSPVTFTVAAGATATPTAAGTFAAEIQVTTTSAGTVQLSASGQTLRTSTLPSGSVLTSGPGFSNPERTVRGPDGSDLFSATLSPMQWPAVSPGANSFVNSGTANLSVTYYPTYA